MAWRRLLAVSAFALRGGWLGVAVGAVLLLLVVLMVWLYVSGPIWFDSEASVTVDAIDVAVGFVTLLLVFSLDQRRNWRNSLEKLLSVSYWVWDDGAWTELGRWEEASLAGDDDIRQWAQNLGNRLFGVHRLKLSGYWHLVDEDPAPELRKGDWVRHYRIHLVLDEAPVREEERGDRTVFSRTTGERPEELAQRDEAAIADLLAAVARAINDRSATASDSGEVQRT